MKFWCALPVFALVILAGGMASAQAPQPAAAAGVTGQVVFADGKPMTSGVVSFFDAATGPPPDQGNVRRVPDRVTLVDGEGKFVAPLAPGRYYLGALERPQSMGPGPPRPGEKFYFAMDGEGKLRAVEIKAGASPELGAIVFSPPGHFSEFPESFTVEGTVFGENGEPFAGAVVLIKTDPEVPRPAFIAEKTGTDGRFSIRLPAGASYYLLAREKLGVGRPQSGTQLGVFGGEKPRAVRAAEGETLHGVDIRMAKVPEPGALKADLQSQPDGKEKAGEEQAKLTEKLKSLGLEKKREGLQPGASPE